MPTPEEIASEQERLYESGSLRDDLNDAEATVLLKWGETQVEHMAKTFPDDFEKKARFLRQLIKNINRFVGQREFNDKQGQREYMENVVKYLEPLGYTASEEELFAILPDDAKDMMSNLKAIITLLTPNAEKSEPAPSTDAPTAASALKAAASATDEQEIPAISDMMETPATTFHPNTDKTEVIPDISHLIDDKYDDMHYSINTTEHMPTLDYPPTTESPQIDDSESLENSNPHSINQPDDDSTTGADTDNVTTNDE